MAVNSALQEVLNKAHYVDQTELAPGNYGNPLILNKVFELLVLMIGQLQKTAAAQANRLNILSDWQMAYTNEMNQIHAFVSGNGDGIQTTEGGGKFFPLDSVSDTTQGQIRQSLNTTNSNYTQQMQGLNGVISNDSKALQSNVNQTNDEVQSQTDMATSILQQLQTILTSIYQAAT
jgi:hypothetical protein